jgi:hypothetical protein
MSSSFPSSTPDSRFFKEATIPEDSRVAELSDTGEDAAFITALFGRIREKEEGIYRVDPVKIAFDFGRAASF